MSLLFCHVPCLLPNSSVKKVEYDIGNTLTEDHSHSSRTPFTNSENAILVQEFNSVKSAQEITSKIWTFN
jgi:hypothetical protein